MAVRRAAPNARRTRRPPTGKGRLQQAPTTWLLACDSSHARFFARDPTRERWVMFEELDHPPARAKVRDLISDRPGRQRPSQGIDKRAAMEPHVDRHTTEVQRFARRVADMLNLAYAQNAFRKLVLVAPPRFLGFLRPDLKRPVARAVDTVLERNLMNLDPRLVPERVGLIP